MFVTSHPAQTLESRLALTLRTLCGLEEPEIARALLCDPEALTKRLARARQTLREQQVPFTLPPPAERAARVGSVLRVLYLLFSEGYSAHGGDRQVREELCHEAIRLIGLLLHAEAPSPSAHALAALMMLQASRLRARTDAQGSLLTLRQQDRARWDRPLIAAGLEHLAASATGDALTDYHLEAGIAACHALAPSFDETDWARIVAYYDQLLVLNDSPVVRLNRAIAIAYAHGPAQGLRELRRIASDPRLRQYHLLGAAEADLHTLSGDIDRARAAYERALAHVGTAPERELLQRRLADLG